jgi:AcrR family transcriptional regulator
MTKSFGEHEKELIKQKLQESCEECWGRYGYKKTGVAELCKMSGISTGAFYMFYDSKEMLFLDTIDKVGERYNNLIEQLMPETPTKYDLGRVTKRLFHELIKTPWVLKIQEDYELFMRKLPPEFLKNHFKKDIADYSMIVEKYKLKPRISVDVFTSITYILAFSIPSKALAGEHYTEALDLIIDSIIENYFD